MDSLHSSVLGTRVTTSYALSGVPVQGIGDTEARAKEDAVRQINHPVPSNSNTTGVVGCTSLKIGKFVNGNMIGGLQEICMAEHLPLPEYVFVRSEGLSHMPTFTMKCSVRGVGSAVGIGKSKKEAKHKAAEELLKMMVKGSTNQILYQKSNSNNGTPSSSGTATPIRQLLSTPVEPQEPAVIITDPEESPRQLVPATDKSQARRMIDEEDLVIHVNSLSPVSHDLHNTKHAEEEQDNAVPSVIPLPSMEDYLCSQFNKTSFFGH